MMKKTLFSSLSLFAIAAAFAGMVSGCSDTEEPKELPVVTTNPVTQLTSSLVVIGGTVTDDGGDAVTERGVCWSTEPSVSTDDLKTPASAVSSAFPSGSDSFDVTIDNLDAGTQYYLNVFATNSVGTAYGVETGIKTLPENAMDEDDAIHILSVTPTDGLSDGELTEFEVTVRYKLTTLATGTLMIGFNNKENITGYVLISDARKIILQGSGEHTFKVSAMVRDWEAEGSFDLYVNLSEDPVPDTHWTPLASDRFVLIEEE
ncbi:hypothetical protein [Saccharicrinis sp. FJH54]|uniref:hypothetical protein n=1 Tax=Saccharicrinis sp. FJH54 TaxID=3344665 RepID=UPI0035D4E954